MLVFGRISSIPLGSRPVDYREMLYTRRSWKCAKKGVPVRRILREMSMGNVHGGGKGHDIEAGWFAVP